MMLSRHLSGLSIGLVSGEKDRQPLNTRGYKEDDAQQSSLRTS
jgi:hypothetical protein